MRVEAKFLRDAEGSVQARFDNAENVRPILWATAVALVWALFAAIGTVAVIAVNVRIGSIAPAPRTFVIFPSIAAAIGFALGYVFALSSHSSRGFHVRIGDEWVELAGEWEFDAAPFRGTLHLPRGDVRAERSENACVLHVAGMGEIHVGRSWTFANDPGPVLDWIVAKLGRQDARPDEVAHWPGGPLGYRPPLEADDLRVFRSRVSTRVWVFVPNAYGRFRRAWRARWPGLAELLDILCGGSAWDGGPAPPMLPFAELILTERELRVIYRFRPNPRGGRHLPRQLVFPRSKIVEFRTNRFDGGLHLHIAGEEQVEIELPGGPRAAAFVVEHLGPMLAATHRTPSPQA